MTNERALADVLSSLTAFKRYLDKGLVDSALVYLDSATDKLNALKTKIEEENDPS